MEGLAIWTIHCERAHMNKFWVVWLPTRTDESHVSYLNVLSK